jgi:hypothetical protein
MQDTLAGRLKWEHTGTGILVQIPARLDWTILFFAVWLTMWSFGGKSAMDQVLKNGKPQLFLMAWLVGWFAGEVFAIATIVWSLTGRTSLALDQSRFEITRRVLGFQWDARSFATAQIRNLRFVPAGNRGRHSYQSQISFEALDKTRSFASGLSDAEAFALIDKMLEIYAFPKDRALDYIASR